MPVDRHRGTSIFLSRQSLLIGLSTAYANQKYTQLLRGFLKRRFASDLLIASLHDPAVRPRQWANATLKQTANECGVIQA